MPRLAVCLLTVLFASACMKPWPDIRPLEVAPLPISQAEWRATDQVVVIADASATMTLEATLPEARALAQAFVAGMPEPDAGTTMQGAYRAGFIGFGGRERLSAPLAELDRPRLAGTAARLRPLGGPGPAGGSTPLDRVLSEVGDAMAGSRGRTAIVIFSDGLPNAEAATLSAARELVSSHPDEVCIHTVHNGTDPAGASFLARLSQLTGCGSTRSGSSLPDAPSITRFERAVFLAGASSLPPVGAGPPDLCSEAMVLREIQFEFDGAGLTGAGRSILGAGAARLLECPQVNLRIDGYTCTIGGESYNQDLSERRAATVRAFLIDAGVEPARVRAIGHGESEPTASNETAEGRERNRRVELTPTF